MEVGTLNTMFKAYAPAEMAKRIAAYGIRKVQLDMAFNGRGYDVDELTPELCGEVRQAFADEGIEILAVSGHQKISFPDAEQRRAVLNAQGGVSIAAVFGAFVLLMVVGGLCSMLLGPDLSAVVSALS